MNIGIDVSLPEGTSIQGEVDSATPIMVANCTSLPLASARDCSILWRYSYRAFAEWGGTGNNIEQMMPELSWLCRGYGAASCKLRPAIQTYRSTVSNNILSEELLESHLISRSANANAGSPYAALDHD